MITYSSRGVAKWKFAKKWVLFIAFVTLSQGQVQYSGEARINGLYKTSDGSQISLPLRMIQANMSYGLGEFDFVTEFDLEYRISTGESSPGIREAYIAWYPSFGEIKVGKFIHAWGAADGNNPTDNLSAYDYYYMFEPGTGRKIGSFSASLKFYRDSWQGEFVIFSKHQPNRLPFGEEDFPVAPPFGEPVEYLKIENPAELAFRVQTTLGESDLSLSYFRGRDRGFSPLGLINYGGQHAPQFGYRKTHILGMDMVTFLGDATIRGEAAYFQTQNDYDEFDLILDTEAEYIQFVIELEYPAPMDVNLMCQFLGNEVIKADGLSLNPHTQSIDNLNTENFYPGTGMPFALLTDRAFLLSANSSLMDGRLDLSGMIFFNLEKTGRMVGVQADYSPFENWKIEFVLNQFTGNGGSNPIYLFNKLEDFSHVKIGLEYSF